MSEGMSGGASKLLAVLLLALVIGGVYFGAAVPVWRAYQSNIEEMAELRHHVTRFSSLAANLDGLLNEVETLDDSQSTTAYTMAETSENLAAAALQERIKIIVTRNGAKLSSTQVLPSEAAGEFTKVQVNVRMTGTARSLQRVLHAVESSTPYLVVDNLAVRARNVRGSSSSAGSNANQQRIRMEVVMRLSGYIRDEQA